MKYDHKSGSNNYSIIKGKQMTYLFLSIAIIAEIIATAALKASEEFTRLLPSIIVIIGFGIAFYSLSLVLKTMPVGVAYAIWPGLGIFLVTIAGIYLYKQIPDIPAIIGLSFIVIGVIVINIFSKTIAH